MFSEPLGDPHHIYAWIAAISRSPNTRSAYLADVEAFCSWLQAVGTPSPLLASELSVSDYIAHLATARGKSVVKRAVSSIRSYYRFGVDAGHVRQNPAAAARRPVVTREVLRVLSLEQTTLMLDQAHHRVADAKPGSTKAISLARAAAMLETIYSGGLEVSQLCALPGSLALSRPGLHQVSGGDGASRSVMINSRAMEAIQIWREMMSEYGSTSEEWLFHSVRDNKRPIARTQMHRDCEEALQYAGLKLTFAVSPAVLRDSMVVHLLQRGMPIMHLAQMLGYSTLAPMERFIGKAPRSNK